MDLGFESSISGLVVGPSQHCAFERLCPYDWVTLPSQVIGSN